jgi:hypothetical protein
MGENSILNGCCRPDSLNKHSFPHQTGGVPPYIIFSYGLIKKAFDFWNKFFKVGHNFCFSLEEASIQTIVSSYSKGYCVTIF